jgi:hypothetical protein
LAWITAGINAATGKTIWNLKNPDGSTHVHLRQQQSTTNNHATEQQQLTTTTEFLQKYYLHLRG